MSLSAALHTPRMEVRRKALHKVFAPAAMSKVWKEYVRPGLRDQEVLDLFDYNDFHWNQLSVFAHLSQAIIDGRYRPSRSMAARLEKKLGVCRTIVTPAPEDAVILQCIVESLLPTAIKAQPSSNAFFSRSHSALNVEFTFGRDYIWFKRWPAFFKRRLAISSTHEWVVTTDISTFFDNVHYSHLRNIISTLDGIEEVILDILFYVVDEISWRPDYLPSVGVGLPQVQFDAPRLLAHVYLYEIDDFLKKSTSNSFVRWVDDITFAVDSQVEGKMLLRDLDALLQLRGVRLNSGKTQVLSKAMARRFFHARANEFLDRMKARIDATIKAGRSTLALSNRLQSSFDSFIKAPAFGHSDKVIKRYIGHFALLEDDHALGFALKALVTEPGLRDTIYRYLLKLGPSARAAKAVINYLRALDSLDDASICQLAQVLTVWRINPKTGQFRALAKLALELSQDSFLERSGYYLIASLWIAAKYCTQRQLKKILEDSEHVWSNSEFLSRQVAASAAKFRSRTTYKWICLKIERHGFNSALSVLNAQKELSGYTNSVPSHIRLYMTNGNNVGNYSIQRFLVTFQVLKNKSLPPALKASVIKTVLPYVNDPHYRAALNAL